MGKRPSRERFLALPYWLLKTPAWQSLPSDAAKVFIDVGIRFDGRNNGYISFGIREGREIGLSKDRTARALDVLIERGFLVVTLASGFNVKIRMAREFRLTHLPYGPHQTESPTKDFLYWAPTRKTEHSREKAPSQSHQRDRESEIETKEPLTVAPARPWNGSEAPSQSHGCDTSKVPGRDRAGRRAGNGAEGSPPQADEMPEFLRRAAAPEAGSK